MKILKILGALIGVVVLLLAGAFFYLNHYVKSPEFKQALISSARNALVRPLAWSSMAAWTRSGVVASRAAARL